MNDIRQKFWTEVFMSYISQPEYSFADAAQFADEALRAFDERFPAKQCDPAYAGGYSTKPVETP